MDDEDEDSFRRIFPSNHKVMQFHWGFYSREIQPT
jgi:hypothetical protein